MIRIDPNVLYSRADLAAMLDGCGVDVDFFTARIKARKVFRFLWLGEDILSALRAAPDLTENPETPALPKPGNRGNRTRRAATILDPCEPLNRLLRQT